MTSAADLRAFLTRPATAARGIDAMQQPLPTDFIRATSGQGAAAALDSLRRNDGGSTP